jgi:hypothetical protein
LPLTLVLCRSHQSSPALPTKKMSFEIAQAFRSSVQGASELEEWFFETTSEFVGEGVDQHQLLDYVRAQLRPVPGMQELMTLAAWWSAFPSSSPPTLPKFLEVLHLIRDKAKGARVKFEAFATKKTEFDRRRFERIVDEVADDVRELEPGLQVSSFSSLAQI